VPSTVQRLIEADPERPLLDKGEHDATVLFLDIEQYTKIAEDMAPATGNKGEIHLSYATAPLVQDHFTLHGPFEVHLQHVRDAMPVYQLA
jgi:class 3 adenylate cyclase